MRMKALHTYSDISPLDGTYQTVMAIWNKHDNAIFWSWL